MKYNGFYGGAPGNKPQFNIIVDEGTMTWTSVPPGHNLGEPFGPAYFTREDGAIGKGRTFVLFPGGRAQIADK